MRLTRRGWGALAVVVVGSVLAQLFGQPGLNAVVAPALIALVVGAVQVYRADAPSVSLDGPQPGFPDERRTLSVDVGGGGLGTVRLELPEGLAGPEIDATVALPHEFEREVNLIDRGIYAVEAPAVRQRDSLGLVSVRAETGGQVEAVVYPRRYAIASTGAAGLFTDEAGAERQEFDRLREYVAGDPLRNVHWKSSAKRGEFLVMEFSPNRRDEAVTVAASATDGNADAMASAAASVADLAFEAGFSVGLLLPTGALPPDKGPDHRESALRLLATAQGGPLPEDARAGADVSIEATDTGTRIRAAEAEYDFETVTTGRRTVAGVNA